MKRYNRFLITILLIVLILSLSVGCASKSSQEIEISESTGMSNVATDSIAPDSKTTSSYDGAEMTVTQKEAPAPNADLINRKVIQNKSLTMETLKFDEIISQLKALVNAKSGYIETSDVSGISLGNSNNYSTRYANYTFRIPSEQFEAFVDELTKLGNVTNSSDNATDVTNQYYDLEARIDTLTVQESRLLTLVEKAEKLDDILALETELSNVRYQIETYTAQMKNLENQISYGTVYLYLYEVYEISEQDKPALTLWDKITQGFTDSIHNMINLLEALLVGIVVIIPYLIIPFLFIIILVLVLRRLLRGNKKQNDKKTTVAQIDPNIKK